MQLGLMSGLFYCQGYSAGKWEYKLEIEDMVNCNGNVIKDKTLQNDTDGIN